MSPDLQSVLSDPLLVSSYPLDAAGGVALQWQLHVLKIATHTVIQNGNAGRAEYQQGTAVLTYYTDHSCNFSSPLTMNV